jgi:phospholipid/cholesterol/gamma-HCH transport system substrate-binding protein
MRSNSNLRAIIVGVFVVLGLGILIVTILTLGSQHKTFEKSITIKSFFDNVNGLQKGNNIWFSGVKVGIIREVNLRQDGTVEVDMSIEDKSVKYIPGDARAKLSSDGLIGNKIIEIYGGTASAPKIEQGGVLANEKLLNTDQMMSTLSKNNDNLYAITSDFKAISARIASGKGSIGKLLNDETMVDQLDATTNILKRASQNLEKLTSNVAAYTNKLNDKGTLASDLVTDTVIFSKLRSTVLQLQNLADSSQNVIANLTNTGKIINNGLTNKNSPAGMLLNDEQSANKIKGTLQNLQSATKKLDEDLEAVQHNFLLRKFFKNKAKEEKENQKVVLDTVVTQ